ncbi:hypothetical protein BGS_0284 [Beggiatoa sp. SS]|nr:hypothetical protein BGS_0284 [Beggiatoa sp. SS]
MVSWVAMTLAFLLNHFKKSKNNAKDAKDAKERKMYIY